MIYFDNAATSYQKPEAVYTAVLSAMKNCGNADRGVNSASLKSSREIYEARKILAEFFHAEDPSRIAFTSNATAALNMAIQGLFSSGDHILTTVLEHNSVLRPVVHLESKGISHTIIECDAYGRLLYERIEESVTTATKAIICTHASNLTGNLIDLARISDIARRHHLLLIVDAAQTAGSIPIDLRKTPIDVLCFSGHKSLFGPQGTGGIYVRPGLSMRPLLHGGTGIKTFELSQPAEMPTLLEAGTRNLPGIAGLAAGVRYITDTGIAKIHEHEMKLLNRFLSGIKQIPRVKIYGDFASCDRCPILALNIDGMSSGEVGDILYSEYDICVRSGGHCAPLMHRSFHTESIGAVRFSFSAFNTEEEVDAAIHAITEIARE